VPEGSRSTILIWAIAAVLATLAAVRAFGGGNDPPRAAPVKLSHRGGHQDVRIYVHVVGAVRRPGLMRLPTGSRVADALQRAGGPGRRADLATVNLAARLVDGQQIVVPTSGLAGPTAGSAGSPAGTAAAPAVGTPSGGAATASGGAATGVHLSTATVEQLDGVDGIGPTLAQRIIEYRDAHGGFRSLAELAQVEGIGEKRLATLREALQP
jgi:competence protein ComEA